MKIEKKTYLSAGTKNQKTREKIRLKLRIALNKHKNCLLGIAPISLVSRKAFYFEKEGFKFLHFIYKSNSLPNVEHFQEVFTDMYRNEIDLVDEENSNFDKKIVGPFILYLLGKSKKKVF